MMKRFWISAISWLITSQVFADIQHYTVRMNNVFVGKISFSHEFNDGNYDVHVTAETIGFAKALVLASLDAEATGTGEKYRKYIPENVLIDIRTPEYQNEIKFTYQDEIITDYQNLLNESTEVAFENYEGAFDPVTAFSYVFRPLTFKRLCQLNIFVFDGLRAQKLSLDRAEKRHDGRLQCIGSLQRVEGYSDEELSLRKAYNLTAVYKRESEEEFRLDRLVAETRYGNIEIAHEYGEDTSTNEN